MISYVLPTRNRHERLALTLEAIGSLRAHERIGGAEVIVVDNASDVRPRVPDRLDNGLPVRLVRRPTNEGAAARNAGVEAADPASSWIVMLDDDSHPVDTGFIRALARAPLDVGAVTADIRLPAHARREAGGLPEVPVGCAVAYRREVYERLGGYDPTFDYYVEEYDLAARLLLAGYRVAHDPWFRVAHHKIDDGRDFGRIVARLVRNNGWVAQRYAPDDRRLDEIREIRRRYRRIAANENATDGYVAGLTEQRRTIALQPRTPMPPDLFDRFTGLAPARAALRLAESEAPLGRAALVAEGKNAWVVRRVLQEMCVPVVQRAGEADTFVIATMSPGPMADAHERLAASHIGRVIAPWLALGIQGPDAPAALTGSPDRRAAPRDKRIPA
jgi:GT2 family glycosyltransferase